MSEVIKLHKTTRNKVYEGSSKIIYEADEEYTLVQFFKDEALLPNRETITIAGKGVLNNSISAFIMQCLEMVGIENHFLEKVNMREQLIQMVDVYPVVVRLTNIATGRYVKEFGIEEGFVFDHPMMDFCIKNSDLNHPVINEQQIYHLGWMTMSEIRDLKQKAMRVGDFLSGLFAGAGMRLVDMRLEFGRVFDGENFTAMLVDEITPDSCRIWDVDTNHKLDFEAVAANPENGAAIYQEVAKRFRL